MTDVKIRKNPSLILPFSKGEGYIKEISSLIPPSVKKRPEGRLSF